MSARKKTKSLPAWDEIPEADKTLAIRTCAHDMTAHGGFKWPESGMVECPDWSPKAECGNGLHALLDGYGDYSLTSREIDAKWLLVSVVRSECVELDGKVKFPRCKVVYAGNMAEAMTRMSTHQIQLLIAASKGDSTVDGTEDFSSLAASGYASSLAASGYASSLAASGNDSSLAASGNDSSLAASGYASRLAASGYASSLAASGNASRLAASGYASSLAASGYASSLAASGYASIAVSSGLSSTASVGENGCIALAWWDGKRYRVSVAYVGEDGIKPNVAYKLDSAGNFVEVRS